MEGDETGKDMIMRKVHEVATHTKGTYESKMR